MEKFIYDGYKKEFYINNEKYVLKIWQDTNSENPREWDEACKMYCWHRNYSLGDKHDFGDIVEILESLLQDKGENQKFIEEIMARQNEETYKQRDMRIIEYLKDFACIKYIYCYEHGGVKLSTSDFGDAFDSGIVGVAVLTKQDYINKVFNSENEWHFMAGKFIEDEIEEYSQWLENDIYGFTVQKEKICQCCGQRICEDIDSCGGFYGSDIVQNGMLEYIPECISNFFYNSNKAGKK